MLITRIFVDFVAPLRSQPMIIPLLLMVCLLMTGTGLMAPVLPLYAKSFDVGTTMVGMIITVFGLGRLVSNIPTGVLSERWGRRPLLWGGPLLVVVGAVGAALATDYEVLLGWRVLQGFGSGVYMTAAAASLADLSRPGERGRVMSVYQSALLTGVGLGPAIGGVLADRMGFTAPFWGYAAMAGIATVFAFLVCRETRSRQPASTPQKGREAGVFGQLLGDVRFLSICVVVFGVFFTRSAATWQLIPLLGHSRFGMELDMIGLAMTLSATANLVTLPVTGFVIDRLGGRRVIIWSTLVSGFSLLLIAMVPVQAAFWIGIVALGFSNGLSGPATAAFAADIAPQRGYGHAVGLQRSFGDAGVVLGPLMVGLADDLSNVGYAGGLELNAGLVLLGVMAFMFGSRRDHAR